ncbi:two-component sensor histidine kinase [Microlunatus endophyticus]|uniref:histidine kinase n=1 Tax=Microlunatus endophyticus TaxID=1716077 RepID=A0A917S762_9ACTN|nr:two-component sensor histidine kinase [Microlunatus endophyticus]
MLTRWGVPLFTMGLAIIAVSAELTTFDQPTPAPVWAYLVALLTSATLFARTRWPVPVAVVILALCLGYHLLGYPGQGPAFALVVVVFSIPKAGRLAWSLPVGMAVGPVWSVIPTLPPHPVSWLDWAVLSPMLGMITIAVIGAVVTVSARQTAAEHAAQAAETRAEIARDIHDVLAHTVAAITVQSNLALDAIDDDPEIARSAVRRVRDLARAATPQLRHSLLQLRDDGRPEQPQPTLELIGRVLDDARAAGFQVTEDIEPVRGRLGPVTELTAARIVQEAVTNVVRHSGGGRLTCNISTDEDSLSLEILDDGSRMPGPEGLGIAGMRERAAALGGIVEAGRTSYGYRVHASIPIAPRGAAT